MKGGQEGQQKESSARAQLAVFGPPALLSEAFSPPSQSQTRTKRAVARQRKEANAGAVSFASFLRARRKEGGTISSEGWAELRLGVGGG